MAYSDQALLSADLDFINRLAACAAVEVDLAGEQPVTWSVENVWFIAAAPGFADDYASAIAAGVERPGNDQAVISDAELLSAVQAHTARPVSEPDGGGDAPDTFDGRLGVIARLIDALGAERDDRRRVAHRAVVVRLLALLAADFLVRVAAEADRVDA